MSTAITVPRYDVVLVGCGQIMTHHVEQMAGTGDKYEVIAVCDPNEKRRSVILECCTQYGILGDKPNLEFDTLTSFLRNEKENNSSIKYQYVILIALPHYLHEPVALKALESGHHVVLEKPLAPSLTSCRKIQEAAKNSVGNLIVAEQSPYWEEISLAKSLLREGQIGTVLTASSYYYESMRTNLTSGTSEIDGGLGWRCSLEKAGGGIVLDGGLHWIRPLRELCGNVERVVGVTRKNIQSGLEMEGETLAHAILQMKPTESDSNSLVQPLDSGPLIVTLSCNMLHKAPMAHSMCPFFRITGSDGEIVIPGTGLDPNGGGGLKLFNESYPDGKDMFETDRQGAFYLGFRAMWKEIARMLRENDRIAAAKSVSEAMQDVAVALAVYESSSKGSWVTLSNN